MCHTTDVGRTIYLAESFQRLRNEYEKRKGARLPDDPACQISRVLISSQRTRFFVPSGHLILVGLHR